MRAARMKQWIIRILISLLLLLAASGVCFAENYRYISMNHEILVPSPEEAANRIIEWVEDNGGYFIRYSFSTLDLRIPNELVPEYTRFMKEIADQEVSISSSSQDLRQEIRNLRSGIASRQDVITKTLVFLDRSDTAATLAIEKEVTLLIQEMESLKGRLNLALHNIRYSSARVYLQFQTSELPDNIPSRFEWINTIDFYSFLQGGL